MASFSEFTTDSARNNLISNSSKYLLFILLLIFLLGSESFLLSLEIKGLLLGVPVVLFCLILLIYFLFNYRPSQETHSDNTLNQMGFQDSNLSNNVEEEPTTYLPPTTSVPNTSIAPKTVRENSILGHYQLDREIGKGAMGTVYQAHDLKNDTKVAIKTLPLAEEFDQSEIEAVKHRFFREAETAGQLNHPNIVRIYDVGEEQGLAYIAMELLGGHDLIRHTRKDDLLSPTMVMGIVYKAAKAMHYAHGKQVIHRDLKPANIMFDPERKKIKLTDFGIARLIDASKTRAGIILGTPAYMSPEQLEGINIDGRSDLFSLGVMLFQLLTGELPFKGESLAMLMYLIGNEPHREIFKLKPELAKSHPGIIDIIDKALEKDPDDRYQNGHEMAEALKLCARKY